MKYIVNELDKSELQKLVDLFVLVWSNNKEVVENKTKWAFNNDFSTIIVARNSENEIIGARGAIKWPLKYKEKILHGFQFHGTCVHPNFRRLGLFSKMNVEFLKQAKKDDTEYIFNVSVTASRLGYEKLGWKYKKGFHRLTWFKSLRSVKLLNSKGKVETVFPSTAVSTDFIHEILKMREEQFFDTVHTAWSEDFLKWRLSNSKEGYHILKFQDNAVIYKIRVQGGLKQILIGDYFLSRNKWLNFKQINKFLISIEQPDMVVTYIFNTHPYYKYFLRSFYLPNPFNYNLHFGIKTFHGIVNLPELKWGMSYLDLDTF